jgi:hypothetical protein
MAINYQQTYIHWNYYLAIENDFRKLSRYIEFTKANDSTFSIELARIIMAGTQETDGIMKKICKFIQPGSNPKNIKEYRSIIKEKLPRFVDETVEIEVYGMKSKPWSKWKKNIEDNSPEWWIANNGLKHDRTQNFEKANLKNAYNCVGALLISTLYLYKLEIEAKNNRTISWPDLTSLLKSENSLFKLKAEYYNQDFTWAAIEW